VKDPARSPRIEPRWPVVLALLAVVLLVALLPERVRVGPTWGPVLFSVILFLPMVAVAVAAEKARWLRLERAVMMLTFAVTVLATVSNLANLIVAMVGRSTGLSGLQLLASSVAIWVTTILAFSVQYWQLDRGGPEARANDACARPDWVFPQEGAPSADVPPGWRPTFVDYLYLGYSTATAFSSTDVPPLTSRAKLLMMLQSAISLVTVLVVAARAINILGN
jgi:uncharacterized membrane protein